MNRPTYGVKIYIDYSNGRGIRTLTWNPRSNATMRSGPLHSVSDWGLPLSTVTYDQWEKMDELARATI